MANRGELVVLAAVLGVAAIQELIDLEWGSASGDIAPLRIGIHLAKVLVILTVTFAVIRLWQRMAGELEQTTRRLTELDEALAAREAREEALGRTVERLAAEHEEERRLLAYDLHNGLAQIIVSAKQHLDTCEDLWLERPEAARGELEKGLDRLGRAVVEARLLLATLRPGSLDTLGLVPTLRALLDETARRAGWQAELTAELGDGHLPATVQTAVYRIVQEALTNVVKHAKADRVTVALRREDGTLVVEVTDTGTGLPAPAADAAAPGLGLVSMQERARLVGGSCRVEGLSPAGTRVQVTIPLKAAW